MSRRNRFVLALATTLVTLAPLALRADEPPPGWSGNLGAGLSWTSGNTDTRTYNVSGNLVRHDGDNLFKGSALFLRGEKDGELTVDKLSGIGRDELTLTPALFAFGQLGYLRDHFKELDRSIDATVGLGWKVVDVPSATFAIDAGAGAIHEKYSGEDGHTKATVRLGESVTWNISESAKLTHSASGLWKTSDTGDAVYHGELALSTAISAHSRLEIGVADDYRTRIPDPTLDKNDVSVVTSLVLTF